MGGLSRTKYILHDTPSEVHITRRHHPLRGQHFEVLQGGRQQITIRLTDGTSMRIPRQWTDADGEAAADGDRSESTLAVDSMRRLFELVDAFCRR